MKISTFKIIAACLLFVAVQCPAADEGTERTISKSFNVEPGGEVTVDADQGDIEILTGDQGTVTIVVERKVIGGTESQAAKILRSQKVTFSQDGQEVRVNATTTKTSRGLFAVTQPNLGVHFRITVPRRFNANLVTDGGNIAVSELNGAVDARSSGGNLTFRKILNTVDARTSGGNVDAIGCRGKLTVQTSGGNIVIKDYTGTDARADTSGGNVDVSTCSGKLTIKTSGGNIGIEDFSGPSAYADTSGGSISAVVESQPLGDCWFHTSGGNVSVRLPETAAVNLIAETDGGSVSSALPVVAQGKQAEGKLEGKINGGGPNLTLKTSGGDVKVLKK